ncbi:hypothetical protein VPH35_080463 [Triticum aestivum]|uniref:uncharacterized protein isoform X1 n=1 Tax=Triticum aestivum TaxID=4565 RepID=UPI001D01ED7D|nr:uncharacterized protein LOC123099151 isoform X1 [Triticum aestivum]
MFSAVFHHAGWPSRGASARPGAAPSTSAASCARACSRSRSPASSSSSTPMRSRSSSPAPLPHRPIPSSTSSLYVVNPATRRWDLLPPRRCPADPKRVTFWSNDYLAFDPAVSSHFQVLSIPYLRPSTHIQLDPLVEKSEWPPSTYILDVFLSKSDRWEERPFVREGDVAGIVAEARQDHPYGWSSAKRGAAYWRQALYVHCQPNAVKRISLSDDKYRVIKL